MRRTFKMVDRESMRLIPGADMFRLAVVAAAPSSVYRVMRQMKTAYAPQVAYQIGVGYKDPDVSVAATADAVRAWVRRQGRR